MFDFKYNHDDVEDNAADDDDDDYDDDYDKDNNDDDDEFQKFDSARSPGKSPS